MNRRQLLKNGFCAGTLVVTAPPVLRGRFRLFAGSNAEYSTRAVELVQRTTVIDMLAPLWISPTKTRLLLSNPVNFKAEDFGPYRDSGINVFHIAIGTGGPDAYLESLKIVSGYNNLIAAHPEWFQRIDSAERLKNCKSSGKVGILIGLQNSEHFRAVDDVDYFYGLGQRVSQLTYNSRTLIGNGATERRDEGLSDFGVAVVERMNKLGMAVDVSHCGDRTTLDAFEVSKKPVLITHSNCRTLNPGHPRCKTDEAIKTMAAKGSVMGITEVRMFVSAKEPTTIENMLDHYDYVAKLVGVEHVGIGSDIDLWGYDALSPEETKQLRSGYKASYGFREKNDLDEFHPAKRVFDITEGLIRRRYSDANIALILGGNFERALKDIWAV